MAATTDATTTTTPAGITRRPIVVDKAHITRMAAQYTPCAGCSAAVKALLKRPLAELRLLNAVMADNPAQNCLRLRDQYLNNPARTAQLLETFPLAAATKKVQSSGSSGRCQVHRRGGSTLSAAGCGGGHGHGHHQGHGHGHHGPCHHPGDGGWEWEEAWGRLPADVREKVATIEIATLEAAMQQATSTHRFCADCKHNVVTAMDVLTERYLAEDLENQEELNPELFTPFYGRIFASALTPEEEERRGTGGGDDEEEEEGKSVTSPAGNEGKVLCCAVGDVEDLISWHEDFDSQEYASSGQRHAATLEHGQREIRSIIGSLLLSQLKAAWHSQSAHVQAEQYLFSLVVHAIRTQLASNGFHEWANEGAVGVDGAIVNGAGGVIGAVSAAELAATRLLEEEEDEAAARKSKSKKKKEKRAKAKARKATHHGDDGDEEEEEDEEESSSPTTTNGSTKAAGGSKKKKGGQEQQQQQQPPKAPPSTTAAAAEAASSLSQSCYDAAAEERLLKALGAGALVGGSGRSLLDQLEPGEEEEEEPDDALLQEMERLKTSLGTKSDHREQLRSRLANNFKQWCSEER